MQSEAVKQGEAATLREAEQCAATRLHLTESGVTAAPHTHWSLLDRLRQEICMRKCMWSQLLRYI